MTTLGLFDMMSEKSEDLNLKSSFNKTMPKTPRIRPMKAPRYDVPLLVLPPSAAYIEAQEPRHILDLVTREGKVTAARVI